MSHGRVRMPVERTAKRVMDNARAMGKAVREDIFNNGEGWRSSDIIAALGHRAQRIIELIRAVEAIDQPVVVVEASTTATSGQ